MNRWLVAVSNQYPWCSAVWFENVATLARVKTIYGFPTDGVKVRDDFSSESLLWQFRAGPARGTPEVEVNWPRCQKEATASRCEPQREVGAATASCRSPQQPDLGEDLKCESVKACPCAQRFCVDSALNDRKIPSR